MRSTSSWSNVATTVGSKPANALDTGSGLPYSGAMRAVETDESALPRGAVVGYGLGSLASGGYNSLPGLLLAFYLTDFIGVAAGIAAVVTVAPKLWDAAVNPIVGRLSDRAAARTGTRAPFLLVGGLTLPIAFAAMFALPSGTSPVVAALWVTVAFVLAATAFSVFQVPWLALASEVTTSPRQRTRMMTVRIAVLGVAILLFGAAGPALRDAGGDRGYLLLGVIGGAVLAIGALAAWRGVAPLPRLHDHPATGRLRDQFAAARRHRPFRVLLTAFAVQALGIGVQLAAAQYVATYLLDNTAAVSIIFALFIAPQALAAPMWRRAADGRGKRRAYQLSAVTYTAGSVLLSGALLGQPLLVFAAAAVAGVGYAGLQLLPLSMLPDAIAAAEATDRSALAGALSGIWAAAETGALALGPGLLLVVLQVSGFVPSVGGVAAAQPASALAGIGLTISLLPAALVVASLPFIRRYDLGAP